jgi:hypothetical protein
MEGRRKATFVLYACGDGGGARKVIGDIDRPFKAPDSTDPPRGDAFNIFTAFLNVARIRGGGMRTWSGVGGLCFERDYVSVDDCLIEHVN